MEKEENKGKEKMLITIVDGYSLDELYPSIDSIFSEFSIDDGEEVMEEIDIEYKL